MARPSFFRVTPQENRYKILHIEWPGAPGVALNFCRSLFLRIDEFLYFAGTNFLRLWRTGFSCRILIFAIFGKSRLIEIKTFSLFYSKVHNHYYFDVDMYNFARAVNFAGENTCNNIFWRNFCFFLRIVEKTAKSQNISNPQKFSTTRHCISGDHILWTLHLYWRRCNPRPSSRRILSLSLPPFLSIFLLCLLCDNNKQVHTALWDGIKDFRLRLHEPIRF